MNKIKRYLSAVIVMLVASFAALVILTTLTYILKWQAKEALIGIIVAYVMAGAAGGLCLRDRNSKAIKEKIIRALIASTMYLMILSLGAQLITEVPFDFSGRLGLIYLLVTCSAFGTSL